MTVLLTLCANCNTEYELDRESLARGRAFWRLCPSCRPDDDQLTPAAATSDSFTTASGEIGTVVTRCASSTCDDQGRRGNAEGRRESNRFHSPGLPCDHKQECLNDG